MENSFSQIINASNSVLVMLPTKPYFDQVAAALGLYLSLSTKKETSISCPADMLVEFHRLVGVDKITQDLGNKNMTMKFAGYKAADIEKVSYDIENGEFKLTVVPKSGFMAPTKDQVDISYSGISADTIILVGGANSSHFPILGKDLADAKILHIGTKALALTGNENVLSFARPAASVSEIVSALIFEGNFDLGADIATNLIAGIEEGSRGLKSFEVTAETFVAMANLMKAGGRRVLSERISRDNYPMGSIPGEKPVFEKTVPEQPVFSQAAPIQEEPEDAKPAPKDWLEPKIYKGTSVS
jgi:hypothetical protein